MVRHTHTHINCGFIPLIFLIRDFISLFFVVVQLPLSPFSPHYSPPALWTDPFLLKTLWCWIGLDSTRHWKGPTNSYLQKCAYICAFIHFSKYALRAAIYDAVLGAVNITYSRKSDMEKNLYNFINQCHSYKLNKNVQGNKE